MKQSTFLAWILRMNLVDRWAVMHLIKKESVAEHSHQVAVIAHLIAIIKNTYCDGDIDPNKAATVALYHEVSETKLQDINHVTKYHNPVLTKEFKKIEEMAEIECLNTLPDELKDAFKHLLVHKEVDPEYQKIVKAADIISAYLKACDEIKFQNHEFKNVKQRLKSKLDDLRKEMPEVDIFLKIFEEKSLVNIEDLS
jgi:5'-deoxynucleotidase